MLQKRLLATLSIVGILASCAPNPRSKLTELQRRADMDWLLSKIEAQYGPLEYKQKLHKFDFNDLKLKYAEEALKDQSNEEFYLLMQGLVAQFKDGHMSGSLTTSPLPGRSNIAYLGFTGHRKGENFLVKKLPPTFAAEHNFPIKVDDEIISIDGLKLREAVNKILLPYRNIGQDESNFTAQVGNLFTRSSLNMPMPTEAMAKIKFKRNDRIQEVELPWVTKDFALFTKERAEAALKKAAEQKGNLEKGIKDAATLLQLSAVHKYMTEGHVRSYLMQAKLGSYIAENFLMKMPERTPWNTFEYQRTNAIEDVSELFEIVESKLEKVATSPLQGLKKERFIPVRHQSIEAAKTFPAYIATIDKNKKRHNIGYIRINTFSPAAEEDKVVAEFKATLKTFRDAGENLQGVNRIVLDLLDNGGGSLSLGLRLAQLLSHETIKLPTVKVRLNDNWLDSLENTSLGGPTDSDRQIAKTALEAALQALSRGERLSPEIGSRSLYPFIVAANDDLQVENEQPIKLELVVLANEMCASMCDIFTSILKDNKLAQVVGKQTMGAGGNVSQHFSAPNSGFIVNMTESLIIAPNGDYLENNGVKPDVEMEVTNFRHTNYEEVIKKGFDVLIPAEVKPESAQVAEVKTEDK